MTYKLPDLPSLQASQCELADYFEISCLLDLEKRVSLVSAYKKLTVALDEINNGNGGIEDEDDEVINDVENTLNHIQDRNEWCNSKYPFEINPRSGAVKLKRSKFSKSDYYYIFLLLATRLNMTEEKKQGGIDGTLLFEKVCQIVTKRYFGDRSEVIVLGTSAGGTFIDRMNQLISTIKEGGSLRRLADSRNKEQDANIDLVVCTHFNDYRKAKLVGFGQCKTGTHWEGEMLKLQPRNIVGSYFSDAANLDPIRMFFVAEEKLTNFTLNAEKTQIFFTRCRIMDFLPESEINVVYKDVKKWVDASLKSLAKKHVHNPRQKKNKAA